MFYIIILTISKDNYWISFMLCLLEKLTCSDLVQIDYLFQELSVAFILNVQQFRTKTIALTWIRTNGCLKKRHWKWLTVMETTWFELNALIHAKTPVQSTKKELTAALIATDCSVFKPWKAHKYVTNTNWKKIMWCNGSTLFTNESEAEKQQLLLWKQAITSLSTTFIILFLSCSVISSHHQVLSGWSHTEQHITAPEFFTIQSHRNEVHIEH